MSSNSSAGQSGHPGGDLGDAADLEARVGARDPAQRAKLVDQRDEFAQILVHPASEPARECKSSAPHDVRPRALW